MVFATASEEERMLSYSPKQPMTAATTSNPPSQVPTPPSGIIPTEQSSSHFTLTTSRFASYASQTWRERRPWSEFYSTRALSRPSFADLSDRVAVNLHAYRANYQLIAAFWLCIVLLGSIQSLILALLGFWGIEFWLSRRGNDIQHKHKVIAAVLVLLIIWVTGIGSFIVKSLFLTAATVVPHAIFHEHDSVETEIATV